MGKTKKIRPSRGARNRKRGGAPNGSKLQLAKGLIFDIKKAIGVRIASFAEGHVNTRIEDRFLKDLPPMIRNRLRTALDDISLKIIKDVTKKGLDVAENMLKSVPGIGNGVSLVAAVDKAIALVKNANRAIIVIKKEIESAKMQMRQMGVDPDQFLPDTSSIPTLPEFPSLPIPGFGSSKPTEEIDVNITENMPVMQGMPAVPNMQGMPAVPNMQGMPAVRGGRKQNMGKHKRADKKGRITRKKRSCPT